MSRRIAHFSTVDTASVSASEYAGPDWIVNWSATEVPGTYAWLAEGEFSNFYIQLSAAPGSGKSYTFTLRINGVDTACAITISNFATTGSYTGAAVSVNEGDDVTLRSTPSGTPTAVSVSGSIQFDGVNPGEWCSGNVAHVATAPISSRQSQFPFEWNNDWNVAAELNVFGIYGWVKKIQINLAAATGGGGTRTFTVYKNGVAQDGTGGTPNTSITFSGSTVEASVSFDLWGEPEDNFYLFHTSTGSPTNSTVTFGVKYLSLNPGESPLGGSLASNFTLGSTQYNKGFGSGLAWAAQTSLITGSWTLRALYTSYINTIADSTLTVQKNGSNTIHASRELGAQLFNRSIGGADVSFVATDTFGMERVTSAAGNARTPHYTFVQFIADVAPASNDLTFLDGVPFYGFFEEESLDPVVAEGEWIAPAATVAGIGGATEFADGEWEAPPSTLEALGGPHTIADGEWEAPVSTLSGTGGVPQQADGEWIAPAAIVYDAYGGQPLDSEGEWVAPAASMSGLGGAGVVASGEWVAPVTTVLGTSGEITAVGALVAPASTLSGSGYPSVGVTAIGAWEAPNSRMSGLATFPSFRLTLTIDGEPMNDYWHVQSGWTVTKDGSIENMSFTLAYGYDDISIPIPQNGSIVLLEHPTGGLIYGGKIKKVSRSHLGDGMGTAFACESSDWMFITKRMMVAPQRFLPNYLYDFAEQIRLEYLAEAGVENNGPLTGGPELPELIIDEPIEVHELLDRVEELIGWPWRINGLQKYQFTEPGSLIWPGGELNGTNAKLTPAVRVDDEETVSYNFLWMKLAEHPSGEGPFHHTETRTANGIRQVFPVNVIPTEIEGKLAADVAALATVIPMSGFPPGATIRQGDSFFINEDVRRYYVTTGGTVDADGNVTITIDQLELEAKESAGVRFEPGAMLRLVINGVETNFGGDPWVWDKKTHSFVNPVTAPPIGTLIRYEVYVKGGGWVRAWETADPPVQTSIGWLDNSLMVAMKMDNEDHYDWAESVQFLRDKITENVEAKRVVQLTTHEQGIYPFIQVDLSFPSFGVFGEYICEKVDLTSNNIDPELSNLDLVYNCTFRRSYYGKKNFDFWRPVSQLRWGTFDTPELIDFQWSANREYVFPGESTGIVIATPATWVWSSWTEVTSYAFAALVFTGIIVEQSDSLQPYDYTSSQFEVQLGVGEAGDETVIANFKGHSKSDRYSIDEGGMMRLIYPVDACPMGSKVWIRLRAGAGGNPYGGGTLWNFAVQAYAKPITGNISTTPYAQEVTQPGANPVEVSLTGVTLGDWTDWYTILDESEYDMFLTGRVFSVDPFQEILDGHVQWAMHNPDDDPTEDDIFREEAFEQRTVALGNNSWFAFENPYFLNSHKRISVRMKNQNDEAGGPRVSLTYVRFAE
jgi:hypothetical protein